MYDDDNENIHDKAYDFINKEQQETEQLICRDQVQQQVLAAHQNARKELDKCESEFTVNNGFAPMYQDYKTEAAINSAYK